MNKSGKTCARKLGLGRAGDLDRGVTCELSANIANYTRHGHDSAPYGRCLVLEKYEDFGGSSPAKLCR